MPRQNHPHPHAPSDLDPTVEYPYFRRWDGKWTVCVPFGYPVREGSTLLLWRQSEGQYTRRVLGEPVANTRWGTLYEVAREVSSEKSPEKTRPQRGRPRQYPPHDEQDMDVEFFDDVFDDPEERAMAYDYHRVTHRRFL